MSDNQMKLTEREKQEIVFLLNREVEEMRDGWQLAGIGQADFLEALKNKIAALSILANG